MSRWSDFYRNRLSDGYRDHFQRKYLPFVEFIEGLEEKDPIRILEEACGMGTLTRVLLDRGNVQAEFSASDLCPEMLAMASRNLLLPQAETVMLFWSDMLDARKKADVIISHGSLEHFEDSCIRRIISSQRSRSRHVVHYVPSYKYNKPSFGDERLMSPKEWMEIALPDEIVEFNAGFDLILYWEGNGIDKHEWASRAHEKGVFREHQSA
jgi:SAM-dependent methyltransferase